MNEKHLMIFTFSIISLLTANLKQTTNSPNERKCEREENVDTYHH